MLKSKIAVTMFVGAVVSFAATSNAADYGSADEAAAMLDKAAAHFDAVGQDKSFADFSAKDAGWQDRDLYVFCFDQSGKIAAHGANAKLIGKNLIKLKDADGKQFVGELISTGMNGGGWVDYRWPNPVSKKIEQKSSVVKQIGDKICGVGIYK